jgi:Domain of unknown function (DUF4062)
MTSVATFRVSISAVSSELASYRREVARVLRRKGLEVCDQDHIHQDAHTLLHKLRDYIQQCQAVVLLVGEQCGAVPDDAQVQALGRIASYDAYRAQTGQRFASYSQWEFLLAKHFGKPTFLFFTDAAKGFTPDKPNQDDAAKRGSQQAYRDWIDKYGDDRDSLTTLAKLIEDVLVIDDLPTLPRVKPIHLPYHSIGTLFKGRDEFLAQLRQSLSADLLHRLYAT